MPRSSRSAVGALAALAAFAAATAAHALVDFTGVTAIAAGDGHTCAVAGGPVRCWGDNLSGQQLAAASDVAPVTTGVADGIGLSERRRPGVRLRARLAARR